MSPAYFCTTVHFLDWKGGYGENMKLSPGVGCELVSLSFEAVLRDSQWAISRYSLLFLGRFYADIFSAASSTALRE